MNRKVIIGTVTVVGNKVQTSVLGNYHVCVCVCVFVSGVCVCGVWCVCVFGCTRAFIYTYKKTHTSDTLICLNIFFHFLHSELIFLSVKQSKCVEAS